MCKSRFLASASKTPPGQGGTPPGQGGKPPGQGGGDTGGLAPPDVPGIAFYFHQDQLSSTAVLTDEYGEVHEHTGYFPDGATWYEKGPRRPINGYLFSGKPLDPDSGLYDFGQRFYDPDTSLWLGLDPAFTDKTGDAVGKPMMLASLAYAGQSPIRFIEPDGRNWWDTVTDRILAIDNDYRVAHRSQRVGKVSAGFVIAAGGCAGSAGVACGAALAYGVDLAGSGISGGESVVDQTSRAVGADPATVNTVAQATLGGYALAQVAVRASSAVAGFNMEADVAAIAELQAAKGGGGQTIEVLDGVRRSKAGELAAAAGKGNGMISAEVIGTGGKVIDVPISSLHSPFKSAIDTSGSGLSRWMGTLTKTFSGSKPPNILVQPGARGPKISDVLID